jgi:DNA-binding transcriptional ArsR family regulator
MPPKPSLEDQLTSLTQEFVAGLVDAIRNASFAEVAALRAPRVSAGGGPRPRPARRPAPPAPVAAERRPAEPRRPRQTAANRAELGERVIKALQSAGQALGVRALSSELGVAPDVLAVPLRELRDKGLVHKHGEKRNTTYSAV